MEGLCLPLNCRGLSVLGFLDDEKIYVCVHQLAIELWKAYDTPRVSVQRKMLDIGINIISGDKAMIRLLRSAGVIENFRATMISFSDAEILCDALDSSRKKRGLVKHALQRLHLPSERSERPEERRAKKFTAKMNQLYKVMGIEAHASPQLEREDRASSHQPQEDIHKTSGVDTWALYGKAPQSAHVLNEEALPDYIFDLLLVAEEPSPAIGWSGLEIMPEMITADSVTRASSRTAHLEGVARSNKKANRTNQVQTPSNQEHATRLLRPKKPIKKNDTPEISALSADTSQSTNAWGKGTSTLPLSSPTLDVSEAEEDCSVSSASSRSSHHLQNASGSTSPERFLFLQNSSGSDSNDSDVEYLPSPPASSRGLFKKQENRHPASLKARSGNKRVFATKLRHFAKTTSPKVSNCTNHITLLAGQSGTAKTQTKHNIYSEKPQVSVPLHKAGRETCLSVKRKRGRPPKNKRPPRPTALSTFVTKKRAMSRTPSLWSDKVDKHSPWPTISNQTTSDSHHEDIKKWHIKDYSKKGGIKLSLSLRPHVKIERSNCILLDTEQKQGKSSTSHRNDTVSSRGSSEVAASTCETHNVTGVSVNDKRENLRSVDNAISSKPNADLSNDQVTLLSTGKERTDNGSRLSPFLGNGVRNLDEDQASVTSSSNSTNCSNQKPISRNARLKTKSILEERDSSQAVFHFNDLFNFYPPKLVIKEGVLVPEHSLSVKKVDRNSLSRLPESHPFFKWSLGTPVTSQSQRAQSGRNSRKRKGVS